MSDNNSSTTRPVVVVLNWNGLGDTINCLDSLTAMKTSVSFDIIVVDNASTEPGTSDNLNQFASSHSRVTILENKHNLGFAGGVNTGIRHALRADYTHIALINSDAMVDESWLEHLMSSFEVDDSIAIATGSLLHKDGLTVDSTGEQYSTWGLSFPRMRNKPASALPQSGYTFGATGGASVYRRELFESIGLFDEVFFAYYEDIDLSFRAQLAGWKVYYENNAIAFHTRGAASAKIRGFTVKQALRNLPLLYIKNVPGGLLLPIGLRFWLAYGLITVKAILSPNFVPALAGYLQGVWLFWTHGVPQRLKIQRQKKVSNQYVKEMLWPDLPPDQTGLRKLFGREVK